MSLRLMTLNVEGDRHLDRVIAAVTEYQPDVLCLQEVFEVDCAEIAATYGYEVKFAPTTKMEEETQYKFALKGLWGVAMLTRVPVLLQRVEYYVEDSELRTFKRPNDPRRVLITTEIEADGRQYRFMTTHFTWSPDGQICKEQEEDFVGLQEALAQYDHYVLAGDFNAPRGREMFAKFTNELGLIDHLPQEVTTTIDPEFHYAGALQLVVDTIFSTSEYAISMIQVLEGISDHKGILAMVERK